MAADKSPHLSHAQVTQAIEGQLVSVYDRYRQAALTLDPQYGEFIDEMRTFILRGGKRIRPYLVYLGYKGFGGQQDQAILEVATSQELLHNFLLIHDDIIDRDMTRYHGLNIAGIYNKRLQNTGVTTDVSHYANSVALLAGDVNHTLVNQVILDSDFEPAVKLTAIRLVGEKTLEVIGGELLDVLISIKPDRSELLAKELLNVARYKTAAYSFELPLVLGALLAGASRQQLKKLSDFAIPLGIAYQLQDDLMGVFGEAHDTGKPATSDLREGKQTLLIHYGFMLSDERQRDVLSRAFQNPDITNDDLETVRKILIDNGAQAKVRHQIEECSTAANTALPADIDVEIGSRLRQLLQKLSERNR